MLHTKDSSKKSLTDRVFLFVELLLLVTGFVLRSYWFSTGLFTLLWLGLGIYGIKKKSTVDTALDIGNTKALRGFSAIEIMLGHIGISTGNILQFPNRKAGILFVGIFFMISGYGLAYGYDKKQDYLKGFFFKRFPAILIPAILVIILDVLCSQNTTVMYVLEGSARWYVTELLLLYLIFYFAFKCLGAKGWIAVTIASAVIVLLAFLLGLSNPWYGSTMCFPLGMFYYNHKEYSIGLRPVKRSLIILLFLALTAASILGFFVYEDSFMGNVVCRTLASVLFCSALLLLLEIVQLGNTFSFALATISYEIYLLHALIISMTLKNQLICKEAYSFTVFVAIISTLVAIILHYLLIMPKNRRGSMTQ